ncbi:MAG: hypothetical protein IJV71_05955 [Lachnospiraceae bacterium]|nr:hypothetical protein [Lachnospiraceae bacterium]
MGKISKIIGTGALMASSAAVAGIYVAVQEEKRLDKMEEVNQKNICFYNLLVQWLELKQQGTSLKEYFEFNGYQSVAVYGMKELGERLVEELKDTGIEVKYVIDRNKDIVVTDLPKYTPDEDLPEVDVMVVTAVYYYGDIAEEMEEKVSFPIVSLEDVVYGLA